MLYMMLVFDFCTHQNVLMYAGVADSLLGDTLEPLTGAASPCQTQHRMTHWHSASDDEHTDRHVHSTEWFYSLWTVNNNSNENTPRDWSEPVNMDDFGRAVRQVER